MCPLFSLFLMIVFIFSSCSELGTQLSAPDIVGVYETQVPPVFRVVTSLGCVCSLKRSYRKTLVSMVGGRGREGGRVVE